MKMLRDAWCKLTHTRYHLCLMQAAGGVDRWYECRCTKCGRKWNEAA